MADCDRLSADEVEVLAELGHEFSRLTIASETPMSDRLASVFGGVEFARMVACCYAHVAHANAVQAGRLEHREFARRRALYERVGGIEKESEASQ